MVGPPSGGWGVEPDGFGLEGPHMGVGKLAGAGVVPAPCVCLRGHLTDFGGRFMSECGAPGGDRWDSLFSISGSDSDCVSRRAMRSSTAALSVLVERAFLPRLGPGSACSFGLLVFPRVARTSVSVKLGFRE